ncbi:hypothetical protein ACIBCM_25250 [Streptomyces sp. NPDC051018]|uniref:hypothetical protein n=1 Tax=Streptomyces sp. NPDC051018 TaxID=3365639 RepID=UPI0037903410
MSPHPAVMSSCPGLPPTDPEGPGTRDSEAPRVLWRPDHDARADLFPRVMSPDLAHLVLPGRPWSQDSAFLRAR